MEERIPALDYRYMHTAYEKIFGGSAAFQAVIGVKLLCAVFLVGWFYYKFFRSTARKQDHFAPLSPWDIFKGLGLLLAVAAYDQLLYLLDSILAAIEGQYQDLAARPKLEGLEEISEAPLEGSKPQGWQAAIIQIAYQLMILISSPTGFISKIAEYIVSFLDYILYAVFLAERFFFLGILRLLGGLALACAAVPKLEKWFWNWLSAYTALWLLAIPLMLGNLFTNQLYEQLPQGVMYANEVRILLLCFLVWIKLRIFSKSQTYLFKVFS